MATVTTNGTVGPTDTVTNTVLNTIANAAAVTDIVNADISASADIAGSKLLDSSVSKAKIENVADMKVLGNTSGSAAAPQEVSVLDEDDMSSDSATALATQQSIKAYVDTTAQSEAQTVAMQYSGATGTISLSDSYTDLDLSSVVGSNRAMVIIEFRGTSSAASTFFRTKGSSVQPYATTNSSGWGSAATTLSAGGTGGTIVIITDANGVIQHRAPNASSTANYTVQAYQVLQ